MPEIKHTFTAGKMNKDLDERLVPNGEYRDAMNIQVRTTDDAGETGASGTVQNIKGNKAIYSKDETYTSECVGSIFNEKNNRSYFLHTPTVSVDDFNPGAVGAGLADRIIEIDEAGDARYIVNDVFCYSFVKLGTGPLPDGTVTPWNSIDFTGMSQSELFMNLRIDSIMEVRVNAASPNLTPLAKVKSINGATGIVTFYEFQSVDISLATFFKFTSDRVLNFNKDNFITGINIIDDLLFFTDNNSEPKKINITRCKVGSQWLGGSAFGGSAIDLGSGNNFISFPNVHTKLVIEDPNSLSGNLVPPSEIDFVGVSDDLKEEHVTVIRKAPKTPITVHMEDRSSWETNIFLSGYSFIDLLSTDPDSNVETYSNLNIGDNRVITGIQNSTYIKDDIIKFTEDVDDNPVILQAKVIGYIDSNGDITLDVTTSISIKILTLDEQLSELNTDWNITLVLDNPLFETKFVRFGYRYKYEDNEYSSFSPWSEIAFIPGDYDMLPKKGYNLGMENKLTNLVLKDFIPLYHQRPLDVKAVDILYKTTDSPNVYVVKTIRRSMDPEWNYFTPNALYSSLKTGQINLTSEMIHKALPANQTLRSWDNVPIKALAQEVTANRLVYGNYEQGYDINSYVSLSQSVVSYGYDQTYVGQPNKSIKSMRNYKFGMVFGDKYGRESPVVSSGYSFGSGDNFNALSGDTIVEKQLAKMYNCFEVNQKWTTPTGTNSNPEDWINYVKYYIKETSNEYYNLVMDRWYDAEDGNLWISFPSADRNKVDEETYIILKNEHGNNKPVDDKARYKIIAIENEAPDFIKIDRRNFGLIAIGTSEAFVGGNPNPNTDVPTILMAEKELTIPVNNWNEFLANYESKGDLRIRVVGRTQNTNGDNAVVEEIVSEWSTVTHYNNGDSAVPAKVFWSKEFGTSADMLTQMTNAGTPPVSGTADLNYYFQFEEHVVKNKPEFDGRFFCKIEKDTILIQTVQKYTTANSNYVPIQSFKIRYVENTPVNPASTGTQSSYVFGSDASSAPWFDGDSVPFFALGCAGNDSTLSSTGEAVYNYANETKGFWDYYKNNLPDGSNKIFLDGARAIKFQLNEPGEGNWLTNQDSEGSHPIFNYRPLGLDAGGAINNTLGRAVFSRITNTDASGNLGYDNTSDSQQFQDYMTSDSTFFRFVGEPNGVETIYKIITVDPNTGAQLTAVSGNIKNFGATGANFTGSNTTSVSLGDLFDIDGDGSFNDSVLAGGSGGEQGQTCGDCNVSGNNENSNCGRVSIRVEFRRVDLETGDLSEEGIDIQTWDPRGEVRHDGSQEFEIQIMARYDELGETIVPTTNGAVWETEPKEDVGLDIYYEASHALPMVLDSNNTLSFAPINSKIKAIRTNNSGSTEVEFSSTTYRHHVSSVDFNSNTSIIKVQSDDNAGNFTPFAEDISIGDELVFIHKGGTETRSKVTDYYTSDSNPASRVTFNTTNSNQAFQQQSIQLVDADGLTIQVASNFVQSGMLIVGEGVPIGTFITGTITSFVYINNFESWVVSGSSYELEFVSPTGYYGIDSNVYNYPVKLGWHNCYSFGNGVESDRIRDDFNAPQIDNGIKVSSTIDDYGRELKSSGMIYSGIYNSTSGLNSLNEFNMAEKITKDLNPSYGSIQAMKTRNRNVVVFTEDKVLKVLSNRDAVFNADGNPQLIATNRVLGEAQPFAGDYGISKNPESLATDQYRMYFTDKQRGAVLRLSGDGLTPISNVGMKTYFRTSLKDCVKAIGTFDVVTGEYNLTKKTINNAYSTIAFNEGSKGWVSFRSFYPDSGGSVSGKYITCYKGGIYLHHSNESRNNFYGLFKPSSVSVIINDVSGMVKTFDTIKYEGSQAHVKEYIQSTTSDVAGNLLTLSDGEYYNLSSKDGWWVNTITTDMQTGSVPEFIKKEGKWFNRISGLPVDLNKLDFSKFSIQGLGKPSKIVIAPPPSYVFQVSNAENY